MSNSQLPRISLTEPYGVLCAAVVIITHFSDLIFSEIDSGLRKLYGENWVKILQSDKLLPNDFNSRDPQSILKELARNGSSQFRLPLNSRIARENFLFFYDGLDDLLGERNAWVHRQLSEDSSELHGLAKSATSLLDTCLMKFDYSEWINDLLLENHAAITKISISVQETLGNNSVNEKGEEFQMEENQEIEISVGDPVTARFLTHSYVVGENGDILDRTTGVRLSQFNSTYQNSLKNLISNLKIGSRLRLTTEAQLCSFIEDHWGFLTNVSPEDWFPNHLK